MEAYCSSTSGLAMAYFYFDFSNIEKQNATNCLSSLIAQLCSQIVDLPKKLTTLYEKSNGGRHGPDMPNLREVLKLFAAAEELRDIFIVVDALDECPDNEKELRKELLDAITEVNSWSPSNLHLLVTSRQTPDIKAKLRTLPAASAISIDGAEVEADIKKHVENELAIDRKLNGWSGRSQSTHREHPYKRANGM